MTDLTKTLRNYLTIGTILLGTGSALAQSDKPVNPPEEFQGKNVEVVNLEQNAIKVNEEGRIKLVKPVLVNSQEFTHINGVHDSATIRGFACVDTDEGVTRRQYGIYANNGKLNEKLLDGSYDCYAVIERDGELFTIGSLVHHAGRPVRGNVESEGEGDAVTAEVIEAPRPVEQPTTQPEPQPTLPGTPTQDQVYTNAPRALAFTDLVSDSDPQQIPTPLVLNVGLLGEWLQQTPSMGSKTLQLSSFRLGATASAGWDLGELTLGLNLELLTNNVRYITGDGEIINLENGRILGTTAGTRFSAGVPLLFNVGKDRALTKIKITPYFESDAQEASFNGIYLNQKSFRILAELNLRNDRFLVNSDEFKLGAGFNGISGFENVSKEFNKTITDNYGWNLRNGAFELYLASNIANAVNVDLGYAFKSLQNFELEAAAREDFGRARDRGSLYDLRTLNNKSFTGQGVNLGLNFALSPNYTLGLFMKALYGDIKQLTLCPTLNTYLGTLDLCYRVSDVPNGTNSELRTGQGLELRLTVPLGNNAEENKINPRTPYSRL